MEELVPQKWGSKSGNEDTLISLNETTLIHSSISTFNGIQMCKYVLLREIIGTHSRKQKKFQGATPVRIVLNNGLNDIHSHLELFTPL